MVWLLAALLASAASPQNAAAQQSTAPVSKTAPASTQTAPPATAAQSAPASKPPSRTVPSVNKTQPGQPPAPPSAPAPAAPPAPPSASDLMQAAAAQQRASVAAQLEAARLQAKSLGASLVPGEPIQSMSDEPACDPLPESVVKPLIESAAKSYGVQTDLIRAVIEQESGFRPCSESSKGAQGLMQLMPETADDLSVADPFDPKQNIDAGAKYLKQLLDKFKGDLPKALGAYNAGSKAASEAGGVPDIPETREYVDAILKKLAK